MLYYFIDMVAGQFISPFLILLIPIGLWLLFKSFFSKKKTEPSAFKADEKAFEDAAPYILVLGIASALLFNNYVIQEKTRNCIANKDYLDYSFERCVTIASVGPIENLFGFKWYNTIAY